MATTPPSSEYWRRRFEQLNEALLAIGEEHLEELEKAYRQAQIQIAQSIAYFYERFVVNNKVGLADAKGILDNREREEFHRTVEEYIRKGRLNAVDQRWLNELENASTCIRLNRLQSLQYQIR